MEEKIYSVKILKNLGNKHKYKAFFLDKEKGVIKIVKFGAKGYSDFTIHKDEKRKERYILRHKNNENWENFTTAGSLSRWILWNKKTLKESLDDFKKKFNLK